MKRRKKCVCCEEGKVINYREVETLNRYLSQRGKIYNRRATGMCGKHQRRLARAIKRARHLALLPYQLSYYL